MIDLQEHWNRIASAPILTQQVPASFIEALEARVAELEALCQELIHERNDALIARDSLRAKERIKP